MEAAVSVIWWIGVIVAYLAVPVLVVLLLRVMRAARKIEHYARTTHASTQKIVQHLNLIPALDTTEKNIAGARQLADEVALGAEALTALLAKRAGGPR